MTAAAPVADQANTQRSATVSVIALLDSTSAARRIEEALPKIHLDLVFNASVRADAIEDLRKMHAQLGAWLERAEEFQTKKGN